MLLLVWPLPRSLATTNGISVDVSSSPYLDVSVQAVPYATLFDSDNVDCVLHSRVSPFGYLRINAYLQLPEAFRSLSRPSSAPDAKAFPLRPSSLDLRRNQHPLRRNQHSLFLLPNSNPLRWALNLYTGVEINTRSVSVHRLRSGRKPHSTSLFRLVFQLRKVHNWFSSSELCRLMFRSLF